MSYLKIVDSMVNGVGNTLDKLFTSDEERLKAELEFEKLDLEKYKVDADLVKGQLEINKAEAQHKSIFVAGWRPFIGWVGGFALGYQFLFYPLLCWALTILKGYDLIKDIAPPPVFDSGPLFAVVMGMLGIGGMRSFDKKQKTQTDIIKTKMPRERIAGRAGDVET